MPVKARLFGLSLCVLFALGCDPGVEQPDAGAKEPLGKLGKIGTRYLEHLAAVDDVNRFHCSCRVKAGDFASIEECVAFLGGPVLPPRLADCYAEVLDGFNEAVDYVECNVARYTSLLGCLKAAGCDAGPMSCQEQAETCPERSYEVEAALAETCLGYRLPPPFVCADGTKIQPWFECDFSVHCPDGSDERADCPGAFMCQAGEVISQDWLCDGYTDCGDGEDEAEANCPKE